MFLLFESVQKSSGRVNRCGGSVCVICTFSGFPVSKKGKRKVPKKVKKGQKTSGRMNRGGG